MQEGSGAAFQEVVSKRFAVLEALAEDAKSKQALTEALPQSRSTIDRAIRSLENQGCIEPLAANSREYQLTQIGRLGLAFEREYRQSMTQVASNTELFNSIPDDAPVPSEFVADAETYFSPRTPDVAFQPGTELLEDANRMVGTATVARRQYFDILGEQLERDEFELELVMEAELVEAITQNYEDEFTALTDYRGVEIYSVEESIPYALWLTEDESGAIGGITLHKEGGVKGSIINSSEDAVEWIETQYEQYREHGTKIV